MPKARSRAVGLKPNHKSASKMEIRSALIVLRQKENAADLSIGGVE
jgi:hypothetical protein